MNNSDLIHNWANQTKDVGHNSNNSMRFNAALLHSYDEPIANRLSNDFALFNSATFSITTSKHTANAVNAFFGLACFVPNILVYKKEHHLNNYLYIVRRIEQEQLRIKRATKNKDTYHLECLILQANAYSKHFKLQRKALSLQCLKIDSKKLVKKIKASVIADFMIGKTRYLKHSTELIRYDADNKECRTSQEVIVPVDICLELYKIALTCKKAKRAFIVTNEVKAKFGRLGGFATLQSIDDKGTIKAGCHTLLFDDLKRCYNQYLKAIA